MKIKQTDCSPFLARAVSKENSRSVTFLDTHNNDIVSDTNKREAGMAISSYDTNRNNMASDTDVKKVKELLIPFLKNK